MMVVPAPGTCTAVPAFVLAHGFSASAPECTGLMRRSRVRVCVYGCSALSRAASGDLNGLIYDLRPANCGPVLGSREGSLRQRPLSALQWQGFFSDAFQGTALTRYYYRNNSSKFCPWIGILKRREKVFVYFRFCTHFEKLLIQRSRLINFVLSLTCLVGQFCVIFRFSCTSAKRYSRAAKHRKSSPAVHQQLMRGRRTQPSLRIIELTD